MKARIHENEKVVIKVWINQKHYWQYTVRPEDPNKISASQMVDFINNYEGNEQTEKFVVELESHLAGETIEQFIFIDHSMADMLAEALEDAENEEVKQELMFLQDLYDSKFPLTQDPKTNIIATEDKEKFDGMETYSQVLVAYIVRGLLETDLLKFTAELKK